MQVFDLLQPLLGGLASYDGVFLGHGSPAAASGRCRVYHDSAAHRSASRKTTPTPEQHQDFSMPCFRCG